MWQCRGFDQLAGVNALCRRQHPLLHFTTVSHEARGRRCGSFLKRDQNCDSFSEITVIIHCSDWLQYSQALRRAPFSPASTPALLDHCQARYSNTSCAKTFLRKAAQRTSRVWFPSDQALSWLTLVTTRNMSNAEMKIDPTRAKALVSQLQDVSGRIAAVAKGRSVSAYLISSFLADLHADLAS
jgi:hypothetical protein